MLLLQLYCVCTVYLMLLGSLALLFNGAIFILYCCDKKVNIHQ